jgi:hypothetical protein
LTHRQVAAAKLSNSPTVLTAYSWMARHFDLIGCAAPNLDGEIYLEPMHVKEVHEEYKETMPDAGIPSIWYHCFEHVKIREFKAVSGKCQCCANLSSMRKTFTSHNREYVTMMHSLHRTTYKGERLTCSRILLIKTYGTTGYHNISRVC